MQKFSDEVKVEILSENKASVFVPKYAIGGLIGKEGKTISQLEKELGIGLDVRELIETDNKELVGEVVQFRKNIANRYIELFVDEGLTGKDVNVSADGKYVATFNVGKNGIIKIKKNNNLGKVLSNTFDAGEEVLLSV